MNQMAFNNILLVRAGRLCRRAIAAYRPAAWHRQEPVEPKVSIYSDFSRVCELCEARPNKSLTRTSAKGQRPRCRFFAAPLDGLAAGRGRSFGREWGEHRFRPRCNCLRLAGCPVLYAEASRPRGKPRDYRLYLWLIISRLWSVAFLIS